MDRKKRKKRIFIGWTDKPIEDYFFVINDCSHGKYKLPLEIRLEQTKKRVLEKSSEAFRFRIIMEELT